MKIQQYYMEETMKKLVLFFVLGVFIAFPFQSIQAGESIDYTVNGMPYKGYGAHASGPSKGLVLIIHDWDGLTDYEVKRADMLAELGYDAFALDIYGKDNRPQTTEAKKAATGSLYKDRETMRERLLGSLAQARMFSAGKTVVMGYCFGGAATLELARSGKAGTIAGYTTFHGGLATPEGQSYPADTPPMLVAHGGADTSVTMKDVASLTEQLEANGTSYEVQVYSGAPHAFTVFGSKRYRQVADEQSWEAFKDFLAANL